MKKIIVFLLALILVSGGSYYFYTQNNQNNNVTVVADKETNVDSTKNTSVKEPAEQSEKKTEGKKDNELSKEVSEKIDLDIMKAQTFFASGENQKGEDILNSLKQEYPYAPHIYIAEAEHIYYDQQNEKGGKALLESALERGVKHEDIYFTLGSFYGIENDYTPGSYTKSKEYFHKGFTYAEEQNRKPLDFYYKMYANVLLAGNELDESLAIYTDHLINKPNVVQNPSLYYDYAILLEQLGKKEDAKKAFNFVLTYDTQKLDQVERASHEDLKKYASEGLKRLK
jgi:tetratricopeptide (TPR) repeat protein